MGLFKRQPKTIPAESPVKKYLCEMALSCQMNGSTCWHAKPHTEFDRNETCSSGKSMCWRALIETRMRVVKKGCLPYESTKS